MNKKNLILTSTVEMPRETWLEFRQPLTHIKKFIQQNFVKALHAINEPIPDETNFWAMDRSSIYQGLKTFFATEDWKAFMFPCLGASEVATIMGLNPYKSIIELYFEKIGVKPVYDFDNVAMFWGRELEEQIAEKWQYWDGSPEGLIDNYKTKTVLRKCRRLNSYIQNINSPWLFVSLDRVINKQKTGVETLEEGSLECKTISGFSSNMWESGIPPMYVAQLQAQLITCGFEYGEIAILKDGRYFEVYPFDKHEVISNRIVEMSKQFFDIVKAGAASFLLHSFATSEEYMQQHYAECEQLAPEPDGSEAYKNYLSNTYTQDNGAGIPGGHVELELALDYKYFGNRIKEFETLQLERSNKLKAFLKDSSKIDLGENGNVSWKVNAKGSRTFRCDVKNWEDHVPDSFRADIPDPGTTIVLPIKQTVAVSDGPETVPVKIQEDPGGTKKPGRKKKG